jgi:MFS family permease
VDEPQNTITPHRKILETALAPLKDVNYRSFLLFSASWQGFAMFAAAFMQLYILKELEVPVWQTTLFWCMVGIGIAVSSKKWGRLADKYGQKPVLALCMSLKPLILVVFILVTKKSAIWVFPPAFFLDAILNAGIMVGSNGYILKIAPKDNRSMFIAALTGLAGICGGLGAIAGGAFLEAFQGWSCTFLNMTWSNYHLLFIADIPLRILCAVMAFRIKEPKSSTPTQLFNYIRGTLRLTTLQIAGGFYRTVGKNISKIKNKINGKRNGDGNKKG